MTRVLLVDDQDLVRSGFRVILGLADDVQVAGEAASGAEAIAQARQLRPDVICMDVQMPGMNGLDATRAIVADPELETAVLILTTFDREDYLYQALQAGASGFLLKNSSPEQLTEAVHVVAAGNALLSPEVTKRVIARFAPPAKPSVASAKDREIGATTMHRDAGNEAPTGPAPPTTSLTEREAEVLRLLAQGLSNTEIASWLVVGEATVKTHVSNILTKLQLRDRIQAVVYAYEHRIITPSQTGENDT